MFRLFVLLIVSQLEIRLLALGLAPAVTRIACAVVVGVAAALTGCAALPSTESVQRPVSQARVDTADTHLAALAAASLPAADPRSGLRLLPDGGQAFEARIALANAAEKSIDAQYYQIADDASGREFLRALRDAAARGVRVRLLIDDMYAAGEDRLLSGLAARPNVELRMFNPLAVREGSVNARVLLSLHDFSRINRRMHNKLFVVDNSFAISGGRNIADGYFGRGLPANFIDMDILSAGPVVREMSAVFDGYWNSPYAYPIQSLAAQPDGAEAARRGFDEAVARTGAATPARALDLLGQTGVAAQLAEGRVELHPAAVRVLADAPSKADAADARLADGAVMDANLELLQSARSEVLVASPYFVPGSRTLGILRQATDNKVRVALLTNSLATTDVPLVHFGYARHRDELLEMGVALYELMPGADTPAESSGLGHGSLGRLHAKLAVVDQRWLSIGSMNMDRRSAHCNTEMGLIIESPELASEVSTLLRRDELPRSYQVRSAGKAMGLEWVALGSRRQEVVFAAEPHARWMLQLRTAMLSMFVNEEWL